MIDGLFIGTDVSRSGQSDKQTFIDHCRSERSN